MVRAIGTKVRKEMGMVMGTEVRRKMAMGTEVRREMAMAMAPR
jgi:hypothetical protein